MKKQIAVFLILSILLGLCGCTGNFGQVNLHDTLSIPEDGIISQGIVAQIQGENAIGTFAGESKGISYEWTVFGSDIPQARALNLLVDLQASGEEVAVRLHQEEAFGYSLLLSITLQESWVAQSATAYVGVEPVASVSLTGGKSTILNLSLDGTVRDFVIRPDALPEDAVLDEVTEASESENTEATEPTDSYLSGTVEIDGTVYTNGRDKYYTSPTPEGKPKPVEPEDQTVDSTKTLTCSFSIDCSTILNNLELLDPDKLEMVPSNGIILGKTTVTFYEGESVFDVLQRLCKEKSIHMEASWTPIYNSAYVEGIHNLYEFDCGSLSGWMYSVNGWYPNYGCSRYELKDGDVVQWRYTCDLGVDVGGSYAVTG